MLGRKCLNNSTPPFQAKAVVKTSRSTVKFLLSIFCATSSAVACTFSYKAYYKQGQERAERCAFIDILPRKALRFW